MSVAQLSVIGCGLIGGSVCLAAKRTGFARRVVAIDTHVEPSRGEVADMWVKAGDEASVKAELARSELSVLCLPVMDIVRELPRVLDLTSGVVTDCGSTKLAAVQAVSAHPARGRYVAGHPMAGHPEGGLGNARADLFEGRRWILCPDGSEAQAIARVSALIAALGAEERSLTAAAHDHSVAFTSHVPQVMASALVVLTHDHGAGAAAGPGFASATRVAGGAAGMWRDIFETNGPEIGAALRAFGEQLSELGQDLERGKLDSALEVLERARVLRTSE